MLIGIVIRAEASSLNDMKDMLASLPQFTDSKEKVSPMIDSSHDTLEHI